MSPIEILALLGFLALIIVTLLWLAPILSLLLRGLSTLPRTIIFLAFSLFAVVGPYYSQIPGKFLTVIRILLGVAVLIGMIWDIRESHNEFKGLKIKFPQRKHPTI